MIPESNVKAKEHIVNKAKEDTRFLNEFLVEVMKKDDKGRQNYAKVKKFLKERFPEDEFNDLVVNDAWKEINNFYTSQESNDGTSQEDLDLRKLLLDDFKIEYERVKCLKDALSKSLQKELSDMSKGKMLIRTMYTVAFILGVAMIGIAISMTILSALIPVYKDINLIALFAGLGAANVVSSLIFRPANSLEKMMIKNIQTMALSYTFIDQSVKLNALYKNKFKQMDLEDYKNLSNLRMKQLKDIVFLMNKIINKESEDDSQTDKNINAIEK